MWTTLKIWNIGKGNVYQQLSLQSILNTIENIHSFNWYHLYPGSVSLDINNTMMSNKTSFQYVYNLEIINQAPKAYKNFNSGSTQRR